MSTKPVVQRYFASGEELSSDQLAALGWLWSYKGSSNFLNDVQRQLRAGEKSLSERQVEVVTRIYSEESAKLADQADALLAIFHGEVEQPKPVVEAGFYLFEGDVIKVQRAVHGSGNLYAKRLIIDKIGAEGAGHFEYEAGLIRRMAGAPKLTAEWAAEHGRLYGMCMICGATLTDETSIERGIGPVCFGKLA